jgi:hypothetical protein
MEIKEDVERKKRVEINMNLNHWKSNFLFPFAKITPFPDSLPQESDDPSLSPSDASFNKLVSRKYLFPLDKIMISADWMREL